MKQAWSRRELRILSRLDTPIRVQEWLDRVPYSLDPVYRSPRRVMKDRRAHCVDGALFAAAALRRLGHRPRVVWIVAANDDGHMMAVFTRGRLWGAVAKSNFVGLRYREPVYRSARELVMSYFNDYFNSLGERTMRGFTRPLDLSRFDGLAWTTEESGLEQLLDVELERVSVEPVLPRGAARWLTRVDARVEAAGLTGADPRGLFKPRP